jgi:hypothetical protein
MAETVQGPCVEQQTLIETIQAHLLRIAELSRATSEALENRNLNFARQLDQEVETELGAKERAFGALQQHRKDHGC